MSTNYYARFQVSDELELNLHIGKTYWDGEKSIFSTVSGKYFATVQQWVDFLNHNKNRITIVDENGDVHDLDAFIIDLLEDNKKPVDKIQWLKDNGFTVFEDKIPENIPFRDTYWVDPGSGKLFCNSYFS